MRQSRILLVVAMILVVAATALAVVACGSSSGGSSTSGSPVSAKNTEPIKLGATYPLTGWAAADGLEMQRGAEMAVEEINAAGGVLGRQIELQVADVEDLAPQKYLQATEDLVSGGSAAVIAGYTSTDPNFSEWAPFSRTGVPFIHTGTLYTATDKVKADKAQYGMVFEACPNNTWYGPNLLAFLKDLQTQGTWKPANNKMAIVYDGSVFDSTIAEYVKKNAVSDGWEISLYEQVTIPMAEWGPVLAKIRDNPPAMICVFDYLASDLAAFTKQFSQSPTQSLVFEQYGPSVPEYLKLAGDAANGVFWSTTVGLIPNDKGNQYRETFKAKFGEYPGLCQAALQYDAVHLWAEAVTKAGDPADYAKVVKGISASTYDGLCGSYRFFPEDNQAKPYPEAVSNPTEGMPTQIYQIQDGKQVLVSPDPFTLGQFVLPPWMN